MTSVSVTCFFSVAVSVVSVLIPAISFNSFILESVTDVAFSSVAVSFWFPESVVVVVDTVLSVLSPFTAEVSTSSANTVIDPAEPRTPDNAVIPAKIVIDDLPKQSGVSFSFFRLFL